MTLLRRAPREVYRVYTEDEFFAEDEFLDGSEDEEVAGRGLLSMADRSEIGQPAAAGRRTRRFTGAAALAGAVGAMGGAVIMNGLPSARSQGRQTGGGSHAATPQPARQMLSVRAQLAAGRARTSHSDHRRSRLRDTARRQHGPGAQRRHHRGLRDSARRRHALAGRLQYATGARRHAGVERGISAPVIVASSTGSAPAGPSRPEHAEFGFER